MKDAERTMERLLQALRDAEPSAGLERRILQAMQDREAQASAPLWLRLRPAAMSLAVGLAIAGLLIIGVSGYRHRRAPADARAHGITPTIQRDTPPEVAAHKAPRAPGRPPARSSLRHAGRTSAAPEAQAASFPAPPLPLTEQEKLLLQLARRRDPQDRAMLDPAVRAADSARAIAQFQQFFAIDSTEFRSQLE